MAIVLSYTTRVSVMCLTPPQEVSVMAIVFNATTRVSVMAIVFNATTRG